MLHIPLTKLLLLAAKQELYKTKNIEEFSGKNSGEWTGRQKKDKTERVTGLGRRTRQQTVEWNQMTALRFQTGGRHQTSLASLQMVLVLRHNLITRSLHCDHDLKDSKPVFSLRLKMKHHYIKFGKKRFSSSEDIAQTNLLRPSTQFCLFVWFFTWQDTPVHENIPSNQVWLQNSQHINSHILIITPLL